MGTDLSFEVQTREREGAIEGERGENIILNQFDV
jgi:hypothetical protein